MFFTFAQRNTTSLVCVDESNKPCGIVSIVDLFYFFLKGDFSRASHPSSVRDPSMSQSYLNGMFSPGGISASGSIGDMSVCDFCMNYPETVIQPRMSHMKRSDLDMDTYDEDFERMKGHVQSESGYRERSEVGGESDRFVAKKMMVE